MKIFQVPSYMTLEELAVFGKVQDLSTAMVHIICMNWAKEIVQKLWG